MFHIKNKSILITGGDGFWGKNLLSKIEKICSNIFAPQINECDLRHSAEVKRLFKDIQPEIVIHLAADVGGKFYLKSFPATNFYNNVMINTNIIEESRNYNVERFIGVNSSAIYPSNIDSPLNEDQIWDGFPEKAISSYAISKRMMIYHLNSCYNEFNFKSLSLVFDNCYGPFDNFDVRKARIIPTIIYKIHNAMKDNSKNIDFLGSGRSKRSFIFIKDAVEIIITSLTKTNVNGNINVGSSNIITINHLAKIIAKIYNYNGEFLWNEDNKVKDMNRYLDTTKLKEKLNIISFTSLEDGLKETVKWFENNIKFLNI